MPRGGIRDGAGRKAGWSERGEGGGRPKKAAGEGVRHLSISILPADLEMIKEKAERAGEPVSRFIVKVLKKHEGGR